MTKPVVNKNRGISAIWSLPLIALCICSWLVYSSYKNAGVEITVYFDDASGVIPGKTQVMAKGIPVGLVKAIHPDLGQQRVKAEITMEQEIAEYLVDDTLFWIVRAELSASSIQGLDTIFSGSYIGIQVGTSTVPSREFEGLSSAPPVSAETPGLHFQLRAKVLGSIQVGTGIYYRNIEIGKVQKYQLLGDESIIIDVFIEPEFTYLVQEGSRFCNASGVQISGKLPNLKIQVESLASLLKGGILLHTPEQLQDTLKAQNGHIFSLYADYESANYGIHMTLTLASGEDIVEGSTKIMYRGIEAGFVKEIQINNDERRTVTAHILLDPRTEFILRENTKFWLVKPEIGPSGISNLQSLLSGAYITFQPGSGDFKNHFNILPAPPPLIPLRSGKSFVLVSEEPITLAVKSPVYFKNIHVGEVINIDLEKSGKKIHTTVFIYRDYLHLLSKKSVFWMHSGLEVEASIDQGISVSTGPLATLLHGGISFTTPDKLKKQKNFPPEEGFEFKLYSSYKNGLSANADLQPSGKHFLILAEDASSLSIGAPILHKNIKIGEIDDFRLTPDKQGVLIECFVYNQFKNLVNKRTRFFNTSGIRISGGLGGINVQTGSVQSVLAGGIGCINLAENNLFSTKLPYQLYANLEDARHSEDLELTVFLKSTDGLKEGSSVKHKGITIGQITKLNFAEDLQTIIGTVHVKKHTAPLFRTDTQFWIEKVKINLSGVKNAETIVFGSYLNFLPGSGEPSRTFTPLTEPPHTEIANRNGLGVVLETKHLGSLSVGSPVYYRQVQVGKVTGSKLSESYQKVHIFITIQEQYRPIIRENTRFWNVSGVKIEGGVFSGLTISTESMASLIRGGIALATPDTEKISPVVTSGYHFTLHEKPKQQWLDWSPNIVLLEKQEQSQEITPEGK